MMDMAPYLLVMILAQLQISHAQFGGCPSLIDPNTLRRLIAHTIAGDHSSVTIPSVAIRKNHTVCLSVGPERGTSSSISLLVEYECRSHPGCGPSNNVRVEQFDFGCVHSRGSYTWSASQFDKTGSRIPTANFSTALRRDCSACIEKEVAESVGIGLLFHVDPISRCVGKYLTTCAVHIADT